MSITLKLASDPQSNAPGARTKEKPPLAPDPAPGTETGEVPQVGQNRSILVVDDNPVVVRAFEMRLKKSGFTVGTATEPSAVVATVERMKTELLILDINFSSSGGALEWNGFTIMQWVRRFPALAKIPVILITSGDISKLKERAVAAGAAALLEKPVVYEELVQLILQLLGPPSQP